jgi:hypothetical protein
VVSVPGWRGEQTSMMSPPMATKFLLCASGSGYLYLYMAMGGWVWGRGWMGMVSYLGSS